MNNIDAIICEPKKDYAKIMLNSWNNDPDLPEEFDTHS